MLTNHLLKLGELHDIPFHHRNVDINDLDENNFKWLSDKEITQLKHALRKSGVLDGRYTKEDLRKFGVKNPKYGIIKLGEQIYLIYKGEKQKKDLGSGAFGTVKLVPGYRLRKDRSH